VGGLENLKSWLRERRSAFTADAREYGLPAPRGILLVGQPGCGKSLTAKAVAAAWGMPLLRIDLGALKSKFVGDSESNIRKSFRVLETVAPCVGWIDEIEKSFGDADNITSADGGVQSDQLGALLSFMQDRQADVFVVATANAVSKMPAALLRKGRFDKIFFVDLPTDGERVAVLQTALAAHGRADADIDRAAVAAACGNFTGSEIAALVPDALFASYADGKRALKTDDLLAVARATVPLSRTAAASIEAARQWGKANAVPASAVTSAAAAHVRTLDI
jgi:SpoVK/Ycf46/Vps4 family AAA+-type ATPase